MLYEILLRLFYLNVTLVANLGNQKAKKWLNGRKNWRSGINFLPKNATIFHCASLGEFDQAAPVIQAWRKRFPNHAIVVSFFSPSGMEHYQKRQIPIDGVCYLPLDTRKNMKDFLKTLAPQRIFLMKYEFWPNLIREASESKIPIFSLATSLRANQFYFKWYGSFWGNPLPKISHFFTQNIETNALLNSINCHNVTCVGDTRFDSVLARRALRVPEQKLTNYMSNKRAIILGSAWEKEADILASCVNKLTQETIVIAPHEVNTASISRLKRLFPNAICYTEENLDPAKNILILDTVGQLSNVYAYGFIAFVGGGFHGSLHNILEPAVYGLPVCFGPKHSKFPEAKLFLNKKFAREIASGDDFIRFIDDIKKDANSVSLEIQSYVESQQGATERILKYFG
ncbi:MAG: hypothetical protein FJZ66_01950 [Bacteroidetes bacterium]|nr:hypothetical protein [Bacteroidota bacterium]